MKGDKEAWEHLIDRFLPLIVHVVNQTGRLRLGRLPEAVRDDLVADVLVALIDRNYAVLRGFRGHSSLGTYLVVVARRVVARRLASYGNGHPPPHLRVAAASADHSSPTLQLERVERIESLLKRLPEQEAKVIRLFHLEHLTYNEISGRMGIPENSIGPLLSSARNHMKMLDGNQDPGS
ncbi:MAG: sigma-70 family RNA polymerase sigma factor [Pirellulaceae bacterium]|nr:sigma-70 family RNA polymerase sigma factor [Pirellulaceae bacterium]